jgi:alpha 1,2-mannosyltransferase
VVSKTLKAQIECIVVNTFNEDIYFNAWSSRHWPSAVAQSETRKDEWQGFLEALPAYPAGKFSDRGIIVVAGGRYLEPALVMIKMLRQSGCKLRIQVWHVGKEEMRDVHRELLEPYDVETRDFHDFVGPEMLQAIQANVGMRLFQLKPLALLHTDLEDVLLLDSDNCPLRDPTFLFDEPEFKKTGTVFWPDYWKTSQQNPIWNIIGRSPSSSWEQESGQLLLHKSSAWRAINLCVFLNSEFYMKLLNGDKDTFRFSWMAADVPFTMVQTWPTPIGTLKELHSNEQGFCSHTMLQHDLRGEPLFVHHNQLKHASLDVGQNFRFKKIMADPTKQYRAVPVPGLKLPSGVSLPCIDVQGEGNRLIDGDACTVSGAGLEDFERRYFEAQSSIPQNAFTARERAAPSLLASDDVKAAQRHRAFVEAQKPLSARLRRDTNTTCTATEFELVKPTIRLDRVCEPLTTCASGQIEKARPTAISDRVCLSGSTARPKTFAVRVRNLKSQQHPYASYGAPEAYELKDERTLEPKYVEAMTVAVTRLETYEFRMDHTSESHAFMLTLDAIGGPSANAYRTGVTGTGAMGTSVLAFTPNPSTPSMLFYQSCNGTHVGWKIIVSDPTFDLVVSGRNADHSSSKRFATAFSPAARLFTLAVPAGEGIFDTLRESCEAQCASLTACRGVFVFRTSKANTCYGLSDIGGDAVATNTDSQSVAKKTF